MKIKQILISDININDITYKISSDIDITGLSLSIKNLGLLNPPIVKKDDKGAYIIVSGFRRIKAMIRNNIKETYAGIISEHFPEKPDQKFFGCNLPALIAVTENAFQRPLTTMEQVRGVSLLINFMDKKKIAEDSMSIFNLKMNASLVEKLYIIGTMPEKVHSLLEEGDLSMTAALRLDKYDLDTVNAFINLFSAIKSGLNKQLEIITNIHEIAARQRITPLGLLESRQIRDIIEDNKFDRQRKGSLLRAFLLKQRYPRIKEAEERFKINLKQLKLGNELNLSAPVNFEAMDYSFSFKFKNMDELEKKIAKLKDVTCNPILKKIIS